MLCFYFIIIQTIIDLHNISYLLFIDSVPAPEVTVTLSHAPPLYTGISLTFACTVTLDPNLDSGEIVVTEWSGLQDIPEERYSVTAASGSGSTYTGSLTISPLAYQDTGTYTCTGTVYDTFTEATASDISINVNSKLYSHTTHKIYISTHCYHRSISFQCDKSIHFNNSHMGISVK